jgi:hypothetical protein
MILEALVLEVVIDGLALVRVVRQRAVRHFHRVGEHQQLGRLILGEDTPLEEPLNQRPRRVLLVHKRVISRAALWLSRPSRMHGSRRLAINTLKRER